MQAKRPFADVLFHPFVSIGIFLVILGCICYLAIDSDRQLMHGNFSYQHLSAIGLLFSALAIFATISHCKVKRTRYLLDETQKSLDLEKAAHAKTAGELREIIGELGEKTVDPILLSTVIEQTEDNVLITDSHRIILYINPAFERSCHYSCQELKGKSLKYLRSDQHDDTFFRSMKETLDTGEVWMGVIVNRGKDGVDFEIEGTISPIRDTSGVITNWVAVGRNMSRFRKLERELQQVQKMDALGTLAGGIAHDFNNILTALMGLIELEMLQSEDGSRTRTRLEKALAAGGRARDLVKQILTFSRKGDQRRKPLRIFTVIEDCLQMLRASLPATIAIETELHATHALILGDATQIEQVFVNLCTNAAHAMRMAGGTLTIRLIETTIGEVEAKTDTKLMPGNYVILSISDTGIGIEQRIRERIFEPFFSTKGPGEGSGIGLSVVHGIVESHRGIIHVESEPGKGSRFDIYFPKIEGQEEQQPAQIERPLPGNERILLVDDEEMVIAITSEMLTTLGYQVVCAATGAEALGIFQSQPTHFQLVLSDQTMPGMTGTELAAELLRIRKDTPIILYSGLTNAGTNEIAQNLGIRKILTKPFTINELAAAIREVLS